jgi:hypothetical protein
MAETECVYSAVRTGPWNITHVNSAICRHRWFCLYIATCNCRCLPTILVTRHGRLVAGLSPRRSGFRLRPIPVICCGQSGTGTGLCTSTTPFPCQYHSINAPRSFIRHRRYINPETGSVFKQHTNARDIRCVFVTARAYGLRWHSRCIPRRDDWEGRYLQPGIESCRLSSGLQLPSVISKSQISACDTSLVPWSTGLAVH